MRNSLLQVINDATILGVGILKAQKSPLKSHSYLKQWLRDSLRFLHNKLFTNIPAGVMEVADKKQPKGAPTQSIDQKLRLFEEEISGLLAQQQRFLKFEAIYVLNLKIEILESLYQQRRLQLLESFEKKVLEELDQFKEQFLRRKVSSLQARRLAMDGKFEEAQRVLTGVPKFGDTLEGIIQSDLGDLLYIQKNNTQAIQSFKQAILLVGRNCRGLNEKKLLNRNEGVEEVVCEELREDLNKVSNIMGMNFLPNKKRQENKRQAEFGNKVVQAKDTPLFSGQLNDYSQRHTITRLSKEQLLHNETNQTIFIYDCNVRLYLQVYLKYLHLTSEVSRFKMYENQPAQQSVSQHPLIIDEALAQDCPKIYHLIKNNYFVPNLWKGQVFAITGKLLLNKALYLLLEE